MKITIIALLLVFFFHLFAAPADAENANCAKMWNK